VRDEDFTALYRKYGERLYNYIRWVTGNAPASDDILQTVLLRLWQHEGGPANEREREAWLFTVALNACRDEFRTQSRRSRFLERLAPESFGPDDSTASSEIWETLKQLSDSDRSILYLHIKAGYSYA
jgi:RNA polymerase sigma factor (sigma-70 family)